MAQRFNRAMELMGWRVPVSDEDYDGTDSFDEPGSKEFSLQSFPGGVNVEPKVAPRVDLRPAPASTLRRIVTIHPESYADARAIGESFRAGVPVIMNLSDLPDSEARRVVDFCAGLAFGLHGSIERVTSRVFLLSPKDIEISTGGRADGASLFH